MKRLCIGLLAGCALATGATAASATTNLITDGDFTNTNSTFATYSAGQTIGGAWKVDSGSVDLIGGYWQSPSGANAAQGGSNGSVDLAGNSSGSISQSFSTIAGKKYEVSFDLAGNPDGSPAVKQASVNVGLAGGTYAFQNNGTTTRSNMGYLPDTLTFIATGKSTTLTFANAGVNTAYGAVIGDVSVSAVPEPAVWTLMIAGIGVMGGALRYGRRRGWSMAAV